MIQPIKKVNFEHGLGIRWHYGILVSFLGCNNGLWFYRKMPLWGIHDEMCRVRNDICVLLLDDSVTTKSHEGNEERARKTPPRIGTDSEKGLQHRQ